MKIRKFKALDFVEMGLLFMGLAAFIVGAVILRKNENMPVEEQVLLQRTIETVWVCCWSLQVFIACARNLRGRKTVWAVLFMLATAAVAVFDLVYNERYYAASLDAEAIEAVYRAAVDAGSDDVRALGIASLEAYAKRNRIASILGWFKLGFSSLEMFLPTVFREEKEKN